ncbi:hypothetical protein ACX02_22540 [Vibrio parahaemolyticus]|uniref:Restriction endonuclease n=1 Tax=Vibrio parahaemolyticus TaxID=670 RepID=A0AAW3ISQ0_VIBPH|nr:hypothetical protein [Vibrio parahaemolyticus]KON51397.1 hypothetical protein ACX02_22540 [Vibrio parahaemolyticus]KOY25088.1 hypothetical protein ACX05_20720 [Vibrio parahaemolyticus]MBM5029235.1 hypothetical protein [Vibrio parahaemolyticus]MCS0033968.1 hypothetical protein [Vibrio parahaemolyticus]WMN63508.1 hypothetical protein NI388_15130 [Vibrio parahaemolyticus]
MRFLRLPFTDPRTLARDIPGVSEILFPGLVPGMVAGLNQTWMELESIAAVSEVALSRMSLAPAMLYEIASVRAEFLLNGRELVEEDYLAIALKRQSRFFDAQLPSLLTEHDKRLIESVASNLASGLTELANGKTITIAPSIAGLEWISSSYGDFCFEGCLIEVKCTNKNFSASDYRQVLLYWLLNFSYSLGNPDVTTWKYGIIFNPRKNKYVQVDFEELHRLVAGGRNIIETVELLQNTVLSARAKLN